MSRFNKSNAEINEEFTSWLKGAFGATKKFFGKIGGKIGELVTDFKEDFKKIRSEQELKDKTIKILRDLSEETKKKIAEVKEISEIQQHLDEFQASIKKIMEEFEKMTESNLINENILLGAKSMFKVFGDYWTKFKKDYQVKLDELKKERDIRKALNEAKKLAKKLIDDTVKNSVETIRKTKKSSSSKTGEPEIMDDNVEDEDESKLPKVINVGKGNVGDKSKDSTKNPWSARFKSNENHIIKCFETFVNKEY